MANEYTPPDLKLTFRVPGMDDPGGLRFYREAGDARRHMQYVRKRIEAGIEPTSAEIDQMVNGLVLFVAPEQREGAREIILDYSLNQMIHALRLVSSASVETAAKSVMRGEVQRSPELTEAVRQVAAMEAQLSEA